jgi:hypothetical protein
VGGREREGEEEEKKKKKREIEGEAKPRLHDLLRLPQQRPAASLRRGEGLSKDRAGPTVELVTAIFRLLIVSKTQKPDTRSTLSPKVVSGSSAQTLGRQRGLCWTLGD